MVRKETAEAMEDLFEQCKSYFTTDHHLCFSAEISAICHSCEAEPFDEWTSFLLSQYSQGFIEAEEISKGLRNERVEMSECVVSEASMPIGFPLPQYGKDGWGEGTQCRETVWNAFGTKSKTPESLSGERSEHIAFAERFCE